MPITPEDRKISQMTEVAPSAGMYVPLVDLTQLPPAQNVRASVGSILALIDLSGYVPTSRAINTSGSLTGGGNLSANRSISLVNDNASPGNSQYYGTDGSGAKGFFPLPSAGTGTVTSFSSGNLSPLFTTNVATATTTPALSFSLSTQSANVVFAGPTNGAAAAPTFRSLVAADIPSLSGLYQPLNANLTAISALAATSYGLGFLEIVDAAEARTYIGAGTGSGTVTSVGLTMPSGFSVGGSPVTTSGTLAVTTSLSGIVVGDGSGLLARTATGTADRISVTNGTGVAGNPTFDIASTYAGQTSITTLGTITTGTWTATTIATSRGGTGFTSYTEGDLLYGNSGGGLSKLVIQTLPGYFLLSGATPSWAQLSTAAVTGISGTPNEIAASASVGSVTLSLPNALTFTGKTITGGTYNSGDFNGTVGVGTPGIGVFTALSSTRNLPTAYNAFNVVNTATDGYCQIQLLANLSGVTKTAALNWAPGIFFAISNDTADPILFSINGSEVTRFVTTGIEITGSVKTSAPGGSTANTLKVGAYTADGTSPPATGYITMEIGGVNRKLAVIT